MILKIILLCALIMVTAGVFLRLAAGSDERSDLMKEADELFENQNYKEAAALYARALEGAGRPEDWRRACERIITCRVRLELFDEAVAAAEDYTARAQGSVFEAEAQRLAGNLFLLLPHWGTRSGGEFHRGVWEQGIRVWSYKHDKREAVASLERARELYARFDGDEDALKALSSERAQFHSDRIECLFDLVNACSRFGIYENQWHFWWSFWGERDEFLAQTAGEEDFSEYDSLWERERRRPIGLRLGPDGEPVFPDAPEAYGADLSDDEKILFLLREVRELDRTEDDRYSAQSFYRQAMLARARFGMDRLNGYADYYWDGSRHPLKEELEDFNPWELADNEALVLAGGRIRKTVLPEQFNVLGLLRIAAGDYKRSGIADEARYAAGLYHQTRQQYNTALGEYARLESEFPKSGWTGAAKQQTERILKQQIQLSDSGVHLPGEPIEIQASYRNVDRIWFVARRIDAGGFLRDLRDRAVSDDHEDNYQWFFSRWDSYFLYKPDRETETYWIHELAARHVGPEVARWADPVENDGEHRFGHAVLQSPLAERGAYLLYAYTDEPPADDSGAKGVELFDLGLSRAVLVLTDLALVEKRTENGNLYFVADARTGAPVAGAEVSVQEVWSEHKKRTTRHYDKITNLTADDQGLAHLPRTPDRHPSIHVIATAGDRIAGDRIAWSGMHYAGVYSPSNMREGLCAYVITDRPVYRPAQAVRFKVWVRNREEGMYQDPPDRGVSIEIFDPRGNKVLSTKQHTDQFGGLDGELILEDEPPLGLYRIQVADTSYIGGQTFRVEEYKKPEFEVTVEPGATHARLGEKVDAVIRAKFYFGAPVTDASVAYKVFREEYTHTYYFPSAWDWLYGPGYGFAWYSYDWFPWWGKMRCCWMPPPWWLGWYGGSPTPVRELVQEGDTAIGPDGTVSITIDTAAALRDHPDRDHRYVIQAEVRDPSRRVIAGEGAVVVTRQAYYAFIQSDKGYYVPGEDMEITVRCLTPDNRPVQSEGILTVSRVVFGGPDNARIEETELERIQASTDASGIFRVKLRHERSDRLKFKFESPDSWGGVVEGYGLVWVCGRDFDGRLHRFNDLELLTDKRTYEPGETCRLMINTKRTGSTVLFAGEVDNGHLLSWRVLRLPDGHVIVDVPIEEGGQPNFFVEALTIADARVHQQAKRICVPPGEEIVNVAVAADKEEYRPGETAHITVTATDPDGRPARAQVCLSAFDKSVLYIQPELTPDIKAFFHGNVRTHDPYLDVSLLDRFGATGEVDRPFETSDLLPPGWWGRWGPEGEDWYAFNANDLRKLDALGYAAGPGGPRAKTATRRGGAVESESLGRENAVSDSLEASLDDKGGFEPPGSPAEGPAFAEAEMRTEFADTALWLASAVTDEDGTASVSVDMPENLTTWKINAWAMTPKTHVGQDSAEAITTKNLLVRLQAPRFFMERDEVVVSANVHNELEADKTARVSIELPEDLLALMEGFPAVRDVAVPAGGAARVDWRVKVKQEGAAAIAVQALTDVESDAMQMTFPVLVHGITKQVASTGSIRAGETEASRTVELVVPEERRPEQTRLEVRFAPTLASAMLDALPYCLDYPYGCTEQTLSRFVPAVLTLKTLQNMGLGLEDLKDIRGRMEEIRRIEEGEHRKIWSYIDNPVFDTDELNRIVKKNLARLIDMQHDDGGWGWWKEGQSSSYMTAYVLQGLCAAQECDVAVDESVVQRGMAFLKEQEEAEMRKPDWSPSAFHAFTAYVLALKGEKAAIEPAKDDQRSGDLIDRLFEGRDALNLYGKALLTLALADLGAEDRAQAVLRNVMQYKEENLETDTAWFRTPSSGWWYWWNSDIETNAWILRALVRLEPRGDTAPRLVRWLLENRRNGYYWRSTRDTALCVAAMADFAAASGESDPDYTLTLDFDGGAVVKTVRISRDNMFTFDNRFVMEGVALGGGKHTLTISKQGPGALYYSTYLSYFTKEEDIQAAGLQLKVERGYFKLVQIPYEVEVDDATGQKITEKRLRYERMPLKDGDAVQSGDVIQVELKVAADNNYTYLCFEDMKPAGCEPLDVRSGGEGQEGFYSYMELRDEKVVFFVESIEQGEHLLRYRIRSEIPGAFHALPAVLYGMYVPELRANSDEMLVRIND